MGTRNILNEIRQEIKELAQNPSNIKDYSRFHKDNEKHISLATPIVRKLSAKKFKEIKHSDKKQIFELCKNLLKYKDNSYRDIAFDWAFRIKKQYTKEDFAIFENWLDTYVNTWGSCDDLCTHAFGYFLFIFPEFIPKIHEWIISNNKWKRRASAVIFIYSARQNKHLEDILKIAKSLLLDKEDLVQKAYGWLLKETAKHKQKEVFQFVIKNRKLMSRTALRYAIEKCLNI
ncbi:DNA alkylation repair protein [Candidatus Woesearchaeota archaeon]|nr:DNA alkylation repair protein [Candidatus Woesearchaeota archaeon]